MAGNRAGAPAAQFSLFANPVATGVIGGSTSPSYAAAGEHARANNGLGTTEGTAMRHGMHGRLSAAAATTHGRMPMHTTSKSPRLHHPSSRSSARCVVESEVRARVDRDGA